MALLLTSIAILALSPLIYRLCLKSEAMSRGLDGFIFVSMAGLILGDVLPHTLEGGGGISLLFVLLGFLGPTLLERSFRRAGHEAHLAALTLGLIGLCVHGTTDGVALGIDDPSSFEGDTHLPLAVVLHRLPAGLTIWWLVSKNYGSIVAVVALSVAALSTVLGYSFGPDALVGFGGRGMAWFQALVAGSLLHVVHHRPHVETRACAHERRKARGGLHEGIGGLVGIVLLALLIGERAAHTEATANHFAESFFALAFASAPALLLGYLMAGLMGTFLPASSIRWLARGSRWKQALRGVALGLPIPVCSCGVVPLYRSLVQRGAPPAAAIAFLVATPELGIDAVILSVPLLGAPFTVLRVAAAFLVALATGWLVGQSARGVSSASLEEPAADRISPVRTTSKLKSALWLGLGEVVDHTGPWILLGLVVAAAAGGIMEGSWLTDMDRRIEVLVFALIGVPVYVCASGATPFVAVLLVGGISPGAALAFLLTGPATNVTTFGVLSKLHGWRIALTFSVFMIALPVGLGFATNEFFSGLIPTPSRIPSQESVSTFSGLCLAVLVVAFLVSFVRRGPRQFVAEILNPHRDA